MLWHLSNMIEDGCEHSPAIRTRPFRLQPEALLWTTEETLILECT